SADAADGLPGTVPAAAARCARALRRTRVQRRAVPPPDPLPVGRPSRGGPFLDARDRLPPDPCRARFPRRGRADRRALGLVLARQERFRNRARLVPAARPDRQPRPVPETARPRFVPALAALSGGRVCAAAVDTARLRRRAAGGAAAALGAVRSGRRLPQRE